MRPQKLLLCHTDSTLEYTTSIIQPQRHRTSSLHCNSSKTTNQKVSNKPSKCRIVLKASVVDSNLSSTFHSETTEDTDLADWVNLENDTDEPIGYHHS